MPIIAVTVPITVPITLLINIPINIPIVIQIIFSLRVFLPGNSNCRPQGPSILPSPLVPITRFVLELPCLPDGARPGKNHMPVATVIGQVRRIVARVLRPDAPRHDKG
jgi:hypothetical protein